MTLREVCRLAWREVLSHRTQSVAVVVVMGVIVGLSLAILIMVQGAEDVALKYAREETGGAVYLMSYYAGDEMYELILRRVSKYDGQVITLTSEQISNGNDITERNVVAKFDKVRDAYSFYEKEDGDELHYWVEDYKIVELFGNQVAVYGYFRQMERKLIRPVVLILMTIAVLISMLMMSYVLTRSIESFVLYRALGASRWQVLAVCGAYLMKLCGMAILLAILMAVMVSSIATITGWQYFSEKFAEVYADSVGFAPILMGCGWEVCAVIVVMVLLVPLTLILSLNQFSTKKMAGRLKGE